MALKNWLVLVVRVGSEGPQSKIREICHELVVSIWTFGLNVVEEGNMAQVHILVEVGHELSFLTHARAVIVKRGVNLQSGMTVSKLLITVRSIHSWQWQPKQPLGRGVHIRIFVDPL